ncbi:MAG: hypothetical protein A4E62_03073 [Syntrophorhabdus sp. PtaU1.Bin002]|nr:MAG: hypothetical protein A4E62_03073 [Syntrophorhabdus sp. PtaU1.Bin002]
MDRIAPFAWLLGDQGCGPAYDVGVIPGTTDEPCSANACQGVIVRCADNINTPFQKLLIRDIPAVHKKAVDSVGSGFIGGVRVEEFHCIAVRTDVYDESIVTPDRLEILEGDPVAESDGILPWGGCNIVDDINAIPGKEHVGIIPCSSGKGIIASIPVQKVIAVPSVEVIVSLSA